MDNAGLEATQAGDIVVLNRDITIGLGHGKKPKKIAKGMKGIVVGMGQQPRINSLMVNFGEDFSVMEFDLQEVSIPAEYLDRT